MKKYKKIVTAVPELLCTFKGDPDKNNALYTVRIPIGFMPKDVAAWYEYRFIGIKNKGD